MGIKITEEQRDKLLDLCETSKSVSKSYDNVAEINETIESLPQHIKEEYQIPTLDKINENVEEKLGDIDMFILENFFTTDSKENRQLFEKIRKLFLITQKSKEDYKTINDLIDTLNKQAEQDIPF